MWKRITRTFEVLFRRQNLEADMAEEMNFHREAQVETNLAAGMSESEVRAQANRQFGARGGIEEAAREARGFVWFTQFKQDLRYGIRMLFKHRGFTAVAVLTLALGLSANITVFSVIDVFFFQPIAGVERSEDMVVVGLPKLDHLNS